MFLEVGVERAPFAPDRFERMHRSSDASELRIEEHLGPLHGERRITRRAEGRTAFAFCRVVVKRRQCRRSHARRRSARDKNASIRSSFVSPSSTGRATGVQSGEQQEPDRLIRPLQVRQQLIAARLRPLIREQIVEPLDPIGERRRLGLDLERNGWSGRRVL